MRLSLSVYFRARFASLKASYGEKFAVADRDKTIGELSIGTDQCHEGRRRAGAAQTFDVWNTASCLSSALPEVIISVAPQITQY